MSRRFKRSGMRAVVLMAVVLLLMLPAIASAQDRGAAHRPNGGVIDVSLVCTGERGAMAVIAVENTGATPVVLLEVAPAFAFRGPQGAKYRLEVFMLLIPTTIAAGETLVQEVAVVDELLPPDPWVSFHDRVKIDLALWFDGYERPVSRQVVVQGCTEAV